MLTISLAIDGLDVRDRLVLQVTLGNVWKRLIHPPHYATPTEQTEVEHPPLDPLNITDDHFSLFPRAPSPLTSRLRSPAAGVGQNNGSRLAPGGLDDLA